MTHVPIRNKAKCALSTLLKRRKMNLKSFLIERNFQTYEMLVNWCNETGLESPTVEEFNRQKIPAVTDQSEGIVVIDNSSNHSDLTQDSLSKKKKKKQNVE